MSSAPRQDSVSGEPPRHVRLIKRGFDIAASGTALVVLMPVFAIVALAIRLESPGPAIFRQQRVGKGGRIFRICKFRSMVVDAGERGSALTVRADPRITRVGAFVRRHKIDELPQLLNVLAGSMSVVGPRPEVPEYMKLYTPKQQNVILSMKPGITDYAAIAFRNESELLNGADDPVEFYRCEIMPAKYAFYERYKRDLSLTTDLKLIFRTLAVLMLPGSRADERPGTTDNAGNCTR